MLLSAATEAYQPSNTCLSTAFGALYLSDWGWAYLIPAATDQCVSICVTRVRVEIKKKINNARLTQETVEEKGLTRFQSFDLEQRTKNKLHMDFTQLHWALKIKASEQLPQKDQAAPYILLNFHVNILSAGPMNNPCGNFFLSPFLFLAFWWSEIRSKKTTEGLGEWKRDR